MISTFTQDEQKEYQYLTHPEFKSEFYNSVKNNPKIHFDLMRE